LDVVQACYHQGDSPEVLQKAFPSLALSDIYQVIAYYLANQTRVNMIFLALASYQHFWGTSH
jgi:uncharacterized protein (DUF433 family)